MTEAPLLAAPVSGFRAFRVRADGALLGQYADVEWPTEPNAFLAADCSPDALPWKQGVVPVPHRAPHRDCHCGVHAHYSLGEVADDRGLVLGAVACWGRLVPHSDGFRAEYATVCALHDPLGRPEAVAAAARLRVPLVVKQRDLASEVAPHAQPIDRSLRPDGVDDDMAAEMVARAIVGLAPMYDASDAAAGRTEEEEEE